MVTSGVGLTIYYNYKQYSELGVKLLTAAVTFTLVGFLCWNLDNIYCDQVSKIRDRTFRSNNILKFLSPITQLHGWWHVFAGFAIYVQLWACIQQRLLFLNVDHFVEPTWTGIFIQVDQVPGKESPKSNQHIE